MNILSWIAEWYISNCDESWEHSYGVKIDTLDNPGWDVKIDLMETPLENREFEVYEIDNGDDDWIRCWVENHVFYGVGDPYKLEMILLKFKEYAEKQSSWSD